MSEHFPHIVEEECIACGTCEEMCPEVFRLNENLGFVQVLNPDGGSEDKIEAAIEACPVQCIHWSGQG